MYQNPYYQNNFAGYQYNAQPQQNIQMTQFLTPEEIKEIQQKTPQAFQTKLTRDEYLRSICSHKNHQGKLCIENLPNGRCRCTICGAEFNLIDMDTSIEEIKMICRRFEDLMQTIKLYYGNAPKEIKPIYIMTGFIKEFPVLWQIAKTYFEKATAYPGYDMQQDGMQNGFQILQNIFGGPNPYYAAAANPYYNPNVPNGIYAAPMNPNGMPQNPNYNPNYGSYYGQPPVAPNYGAAPNPYGAPNTMPNNGPVVQDPGTGYGFNPTIQNPNPNQTPSVGVNPIGFVENPQDFTATVPQNNVAQGQQVQGPTTTTGGQAPLNPNMVQPADTKVNVTPAPSFNG